GRGFFQARVYDVSSRAPLGGIEAGGWKVVLSDKPNAFIKAGEQVSKGTDLTPSLGFVLNDSAVIVDVIPTTPGAAAGMTPGQKRVAVNGRKYSDDVIHEALR